MKLSNEYKDFQTLIDLANHIQDIFRRLWMNKIQPDPSQSLSEMKDYPYDIIRKLGMAHAIISSPPHNKFVAIFPKIELLDNASKIIYDELKALSDKGWSIPEILYPPETNPNSTQRLQNSDYAIIGEYYPKLVEFFKKPFFINSSALKQAANSKEPAIKKQSNSKNKVSDKSLNIVKNALFTAFDSMDPFETQQGIANKAGVSVSIVSRSLERLRQTYNFKDDLNLKNKRKK